MHGSIPGWLRASAALPFVAVVALQTAGDVGADPEAEATDVITVAAVDANGQGSLWPINLAALENHACAVAGRNLTHDEWSQFITGYKYSQVCP